MNPEPRTLQDYSDRGSEAARRVLVDLGQVLGSFFTDSIVVVGGMAPALLLTAAEEAHIGSIDIDLALETDKLREGRYAEIVKLLLDTGVDAATPSYRRPSATCERSSRRWTRTARSRLSPSTTHRCSMNANCLRVARTNS